MRLAAPIAGLLLIASLANSLAIKKRAERSIRWSELDKPSYGRSTLQMNPVHYDLEIKPNLSSEAFLGKINISTKWHSHSDVIIFDAHKEMKIETVTVECGNPSSSHPPQALEVVEMADSNDFMRSNQRKIQLAQYIKGGDECLIHMKFSSKFNRYMEGIFKQDFWPECTYVATYSRPQYAREWFPCFDDPAYKSTFDLKVVRPKNMTARSNTPVNKSVEIPGDPDNMMDHFQRTPKMSTYQLALFISNCHSVSPTTKIDPIDNTTLQLRVWGRKEKMETLTRGADKIARIINHLQKYFNMSIGLPKLDVVARPVNNPNIENWGLMLYIEQDLERLNTYDLVYELIYQWIGQRMTLMHWHDLYMNRALNSFLASKITEEIEPNPDQAGMNKWSLNMLYALYYAFGETRPFSRVSGIRDQVTAAKTALVLRMLNYTLGEEVFDEGIRELLHKKVSFSNNDVFAHLKEVASRKNVSLPEGLQIDQAVSFWINRDRVPFVTVVRDYEAGNVTLAQYVFLREPPPASGHQLSYKWNIPIIAITQDTLNSRNYTTCTWLRNTGERELVMKDFTTPDKFIIVNPEEIGLYPVNYDNKNWNMLSEYLQGPNRETIPPMTRAKLLHDSWNLAYGGNLCFDVAFNMTLFMKNERNHAIWEPMFIMIDHVGRKIQRSDVRKKFEVYTSSFLEPLYTDLGVKSQRDEPAWKTRMRGLAKNFLCQAGYEPCVTEARNQYRKWMNDESPDDGNPLRNEFLCPVFKWGNLEEFEFGIERIIHFPDIRSYRVVVERPYLIRTLAGCVNDNKKIDRLLTMEMFLNPNLTNYNLHLLYTNLASSLIGQPAVFRFIRENWDKVKDRFKTDERLWESILNTALLFNDREGYNRVQELFNEKKGQDEDDDEVFTKALKTIENEIAWNDKNLKVIDDWLTNYLNKNQLGFSSKNFLAWPAPPNIQMHNNTVVELEKNRSDIANASTTTFPFAG